MKIVAGNDATCVLLSDDSVRCWGENIFGVLGTGDALHRGTEPGQMGDQLLAVDLGTGNAAQDIAMGAVHVCALLSDGTVKCWGYNAEGGLGLGDTDPRGGEPGGLGDSLPRVDLDGARVRALSGGLTFSCALLDDFTVKCWGSNPYGQLGSGDREDRGDEPGEMGAALPRVFLTF
jgi:alpha-tubulin suppressor-like RCC1 family protein